jgi:exportin-1
LIKISRVEDREIFKICLEYWAKLVQDLFEEALTMAQPTGALLSMNGYKPASRKDIYVDVLSNLRVVMIECMVKPEEVSGYKRHAYVC